MKVDKIQQKAEKIEQKIAEKKKKLDRLREAIEENKLRKEREEQELIELEQMAVEHAYKELNLALLGEGIDIRTIDKEQLVQLIIENKTVLIEGDVIGI